MVGTYKKECGRLNSVEKTIEEIKSLVNSSYSKAGYAPPTPAHYPGNAREKESRTRAVTQLPSHLAPELSSQCTTSV